MKKGFTLIELLVVVLIIGILAAIALPQYQKAVAKSRFAEALTNLKTIAQADSVCRMATGNLWCSMEDIDVSIGELNGSCVGALTSEGGSCTKYFEYAASGSAAGGPAAARYIPEEVCLCVLDSGEIVIHQNQENTDCSAKPAKFDYASLLHLRKDSAHCSCC